MAHEKFELSRKYLHDVPLDAAERLTARYLMGTGSKIGQYIENRNLLRTDTEDVDSFFNLAQLGYIMTLKMDGVRPDEVELERLFRDTRVQMEGFDTINSTFPARVYGHVSLAYRVLIQNQNVALKELGVKDDYPFVGLAEAITYWSGLAFTEAIWFTTQRIARTTHQRLQALGPITEYESRRLLEALHFMQTCVYLAKGFDQLST